MPTINESIVNWMLAVFVGNYNLTDGFDRAFKFFTFNGYLFSLGFRTIPFIALFFLTHMLKNRLPNYVNVIGWCWLIGIIFFIASSYWDVQHSLYTNAHTSSTSAIAFIFIPIYAIGVGLISGVLGFVCAAIYNQIRKRTYKNFKRKNTVGCFFPQHFSQLQFSP